MQGNLEKRDLKDIDLDEISFVKTPANKRTFLFYKGLEKAGDYVCPECGYKKTFDKPVRNPKCPKCGTIMECASGKSEDGSMELKKDQKLEEFVKSFEGDGFTWGSIDLAKEYKEFLGEEMESEQVEKQKKLPEKVYNAIKGAFNILNKYKDDLPSDLRSAVESLAKYAAGKYPYPKPYKKGEEEEGEDVEKSGKKLSKDTIGKLMAIRKILDELLPEDVKKALEEEAKEPDPIAILKSISDSLTAFGKRLEKLEKGEGGKEESGDGKGEDEGPADEVTKQLEAIADRLDTLEKQKPAKKGLEGDGKEELAKSDEDLWPSVKV